MLLTQSDELGSRFDCPIYCAEPALLGYDNNVHDLFELDLIVYCGTLSMLTAVLRGGVLELLRVPVELLELTQVERALVPVAQAMGLAQIRRDLDGLAYRIPKQIDVGRVVHVRRTDKGVTA